MNKRLFIRLEVIGVFFVFILATLLHFSYNWSSGAMWSILIGAVNESVWEHVKIFTMPFIIWAAIEFAVVKPPFKKFVVAKLICLYMLAISMIGFFYLYSSFTGHSILFIDISSSIVILILCYILSYKLVTSENSISKYFSTASFLLAIFIAMYVSFTVAPPKIELFRDPRNNEFGIPKTSQNENKIYAYEREMFL